MEKKKSKTDRVHHLPTKTTGTNRLGAIIKPLTKFYINKNTDRTLSKTARQGCINNIYWFETRNNQTREKKKL